MGDLILGAAVAFGLSLVAAASLGPYFRAAYASLPPSAMADAEVQAGLRQLDEISLRSVISRDLLSWAVGTSVLSLLLASSDVSIAVPVATAVVLAAVPVSIHCARAWDAAESRARRTGEKRRWLSSRLWTAGHFGLLTAANAGFLIAWVLLAYAVVEALD